MGISGPLSLEIDRIGIKIEQFIEGHRPAAPIRRFREAGFKRIVIVVEGAVYSLSAIPRRHIKDPIVWLLSRPSYPDSHRRICVRRVALAHFLQHAADIGPLVREMWPDGLDRRIGRNRLDHMKSPILPLTYRSVSPHVRLP